MRQCTSIMGSVGPLVGRLVRQLFDDPHGELGFSGQIRAIILGFGPFCSDLGMIAWVWAIWQNLGQKRPQRRRSPEDGAGGTNGQTDGEIPPVFYRTSSPSGPLPCSPST